MKNNPGKNVADDHSFKQLGKDIVLCMELVELRQQLEYIIDDYDYQIKNETARLTGQGYDMTELKIVKISGMVVMMLRKLGMKPAKPRHIPMCQHPHLTGHNIEVTFDKNKMKDGFYWTLDSKGNPTPIEYYKDKNVYVYMGDNRAYCDIDKIEILGKIEMPINNEKGDE